MFERKDVTEKLLGAIYEIQLEENAEDVLKVIVKAGIEILNASSGAGGIVDGNDVNFEVLYTNGRWQKINKSSNLKAPFFQNTHSKEKLIILKSGEKRLKNYADFIECGDIDNAILIFLVDRDKNIGVVSLHNLADLEHIDGFSFGAFFSLAAAGGIELNKIKKFKQGQLTVRPSADLKYYTDKIANMLGILVITLNQELKITDLNKYAADTTGYKKGEVLGKNFLNVFIPSEFQEKAVNTYQNAITEQKHFWTYESPLLCKKGKKMWVLWRNIFIKGKEDSFVLLSGVEVTKWHELRESLRESEERFRAMADSTSVGILIYQDNKFVYSNDAVQKIGGYTKKDIIGMNFWDAVYPEDRDLVKRRGLERQQGKDIPANYEFRIVTKDGKIKWIDFSAGFIMYKGRPAGLATLVDITERKNAELSLKESEERFRLLAESSPVGIYLFA